MSDCTMCKRPITTTRQNSSITCGECNKACHSACVNMNKEDVECVVTQGQVWRCPPCLKSRRGSMTSSSSAPDSGKQPDLTQVVSMLSEAKEERKNMEIEMNKAFDFVHKLIEEQKTVLSDQNKKMSDFITLIESLQAENKLLKDKVKELESRIDENEQYLRANTLEIHGIPELPNEDTYEIISKVGAALDLTISRDMVDVCHRLGKRAGSERPAGIIVKFVRREIKQNMLIKRRAKKSSFTTETVGYNISSGPNIVYINESLSPGRRRVYAAAREARKSKHYKYLWIRNGKIFLRKDENSAAILVATLDDVNSL